MIKTIITCEHGGNQVPKPYKRYFANAAGDLNSHKGMDFGALHLLEAFLELEPAFSQYSEVTRLLVDLNRLHYSSTLFTDYGRDFPDEVKKEIMNTYYYPYWNKVEGEVEKLIHDQNKVVHISLHSFTPVLNGEERKTDIGLLFDPSRVEEAAFCLRWKKKMRKFGSGIRIRFNYPFAGTNDGLTKYLREKFTENYIGIELEVNQHFVSGNSMDEKIRVNLVKSFGESLHHRDGKTICLNNENF